MESVTDAWYIDEGISGARLDRPALDRLRDCAHRGEFDAVVVLSRDRLRGTMRTNGY